MTRYQLVLRDPAGEDHVVLFDDSEAAEDNFAFCGQSLREGALIEVADGAMYIIVE
ncbi:MAG TPA: hypothetical protein VI159_10930 [Gemmatimonadales bacterium]